MAAFSEFGVMPELTKALDQMDWTLPTEIQAEAIPLILGGGDILMASETGTGKTGAFCIPIVQVVFEHLIQPDRPAKQTSQQHKESELTMSPVDRDFDLVLSQDLRTAQSKSGQWQGCRATKGVRASKGTRHKVYFEVYFNDQGLARVGWSFANGSLELGSDRDGYGYGGTGKKSNNKQYLDFGQPFGEKFDIVGCILDLSKGELSFSKNGRNLGVAFKVPMNKLEKQELYPTICVKNAGCQVRLGPVSERDDCKPKDCIWMSELPTECLIENTCDKAGSKGGDSEAGPLAIVLEPSRELAKQTFDCLELFSQGLKVTNALFIGGGSENKKQDQQAHILVCTPGRLSELIDKNQISFKNVHFFILDEADALIQQGQERLVRTVAKKLPRMFASGRRTQIILCSATLHNLQVKKLAQDLMYFPTWIDLKGEDSVPETVHHVFVDINPKKDKIYSKLEGSFYTDGVHAADHCEPALFKRKDPKTPEEVSEAIKLMKFYYTVKAIESLNMDQGIIFCRTKLDCDNLDEFMRDTNKHTKSAKYSCVRLHSSLSQQERTSNLDTFKKGQVKFLICTDVAARGIDVRGVPYLIQVTLPDEVPNYVHRIGRVGRAERMGLAISLVASYPEKVWYHSCRKRECHNTRLLEEGGCCKWFDERSMLGSIEESLKSTVQEISTDFKIQVNEFDGKVVYGAKKLEHSATYAGHVEQLKAIVSCLSELESKAQANFLSLYM